MGEGGCSDFHQGATVLRIQLRILLTPLETCPLVSMTDSRNFRLTETFPASLVTRSDRMPQFWPTGRE